VGRGDGGRASGADGRGGRRNVGKSIWTGFLPWLMMPTQSFRSTPMGMSDSCQPRDESSLLGQRVGALLRALDVIADCLNLGDDRNILAALDVFNERIDTLHGIVNEAARGFLTDSIAQGAESGGDFTS
jgi:hypothetical protein